MSAAVGSTTRPRPGAWAGVVLSAVVVLIVGADGAMMLLFPKFFVVTFQQDGMPMTLAPVLGAIALLAALVYALPQTAVLGAILLTGFLGGAISTHVRAGHYGFPEVLSLALGAFAWGGLYLRDARLRALLPVRRRSIGVEPVASASRGENNKSEAEGGAASASSMGRI